MKQRLIWALAGVLVAPGLSKAQQEQSPAIDKSSFTLFNPTPANLMRDMSTDRPDTTESPVTVDAGHVQVELSLFDYAYNDDDGVRSSTWAVLPSNLKVGLLNNVDLQFIFTPYERTKVEADGDDEVVDGFSDDTQIRLKVNLWGNDGPQPGFGNTAFAVMPFVKFPTGSDDLSNDHVEGGLILPLAFELPGEFGVGVMAEVDVVYNANEDAYGVRFVHTMTVSHAIPGVENLSGYVEYIGIAPNDIDETYQAIGSGGLTYAINDNWILDVGGTLGISDSADDVTVFVGTSFRF